MHFRIKGVFFCIVSIEMLKLTWYRMRDTQVLIINAYTLQRKSHLLYVFLFWELCGISPNFHIHVSMSDLYVPRIGPHISCNRIADRLWEYINRSQTHECGYWDFGRAIPFLGIFISNIRYWLLAVQLPKHPVKSIISRDSPFKISSVV
jgi:hypothetical protein